MHSIIKYLKTKLSFWITQKQIENWKNDKDIFFILSQGRSGTKFLTNLLNNNPNAEVRHEPVGRDFKAYLKAYYSEKEAERYISKFRKKEIYIRNRKLNIKTYGEVNSVLRRHCKALQKQFPDAKFLHLVRDGRDVVRSMMSRDTMTQKDDISNNIKPKKGDPFYHKWDELSRFEKISWYWMIENKYLSKHIGEYVNFEEIISDYNYFLKNILQNIGISISKKTWEKEVNQPKNVTKEYSIPNWTEWDKKRKGNFWKICQDEMEKYGYEE